MDHTIRIVDVTTASLSQWERVCTTCAYTTFFHTPMWAEIFSVYTNGRIKPSPIKITFNDHTSVIVPLSRKDYMGGAYKIYLSSPAGTFGGWLSSDLLSPVHTEALVDYMIKLGNITWRENPFDPLLNKVLIPGAHNDFTQVIDLSQSPECLRKAASRAHAKALRKAMREGVIVKEAVGFFEWQQHFASYERSIVRWENAGTIKKNIKPYSRDLFKIIFDRYHPHRRLWCALYKGELAASVLCFYWKSHAVAWHGAANEAFFSVRPNNLLYQCMIKHARENGFQWFDCNTPGGLSGVIEFKDNLGAKRLSSRFLDKMTVTRTLLRNARQVVKHIHR